MGRGPGLLNWLRTTEGHVVSVLVASFVLVFGAVVALEFSGRETAIDVVKAEATIGRLQATYSVLKGLEGEQAQREAKRLSSCHFGYAVSLQPDANPSSLPDIASLRNWLSRQLGLDLSAVSLGYRVVTVKDFSFDECSATEIGLPNRSLIVSLLLDQGEWLNVEIHPHEMHVDEFTASLGMYTLIFALVGSLTVYLVKKIGAPLRLLTSAMHQFGQGLEVEEISVQGPPDIANAIQSFNKMQRRVRSEVRHRMRTLAAIGHDLRSPLTSLRLKAELLTDSEARQTIARSISKMEHMAANAVDILREDVGSEVRREVDIARLTKEECEDMASEGLIVEFEGPESHMFPCKPILVTRALRNLVENANQYASGAKLELCAQVDAVTLIVSDDGPGIPEHSLERALAPFERLSESRNGDQGGFGLGLWIVANVAKAHSGTLRLVSRDPSGFSAILTLAK